MLSFFSGAFALAGLAAAVGPVLIHLFNRRRYRVVEWAAMEFLREAVEQSRRALRLRDVFLLVLRTLCIVLFGLAMARPYFSRSAGAFLADEAVHAVLIIDNSLSMSFEKLDGTVLDEAKAKARELIRRLPDGSWISVLPLCGSSSGASRDAYRTKEDAIEALATIQAVDREGSASQAFDVAIEALKRVTELPSKRVVLFGDQQLINWPAGGLSQLKELPELQVVDVSPAEPDNAWISDFRVRDGVADVETPAVLTATIRYEGRVPRPGVPVTLTIDGIEAATRTVDLEPGQSREVTFTCAIDVRPEPGRPAFAAASVSMPPDRLPGDDRCALCVPVLAGLPVVFIDQLGEEEDPAKGRYGETFRLRRLLAPVTARNGDGRQLVQVRHKQIGQLDRALLEDARLVVIAGVERPGPSVELLRDYVRQGGQLVVAAGASFDPAAWTADAWLDGAGILPAPLKPNAVGKLPEESPRDLQPFSIAFESLAHDYFIVGSGSRDELEDLYRLPLFFKAVEADVSAATLGAMEDAAVKRAMRTPGVVEPSWLLWRGADDVGAGILAPADVARLERPRVLASYTNGLPFLVERKIGRGQALFVSTGLYSSWSTITRTNAVLIFDRIFRAMLERTLPRRNVDSVETFVLPIAPTDRRAMFTLTRPNGEKEPLGVDALGPDSYGVTVRSVVQRGHYTVTARRVGDDGSAGEQLWEVQLAANGPERESELKAIDEAGLKDRLGDASYRWVARGETVPLEGARIGAQGLWRWLMAAVLACLLLEMAILAKPKVADEAKHGTSGRIERSVAAP